MAALCFHFLYCLGSLFAIIDCRIYNILGNHYRLPFQKQPTTTGEGILSTIATTSENTKSRKYNDQRSQWIFDCDRIIPFHRRNSTNRHHLQPADIGIVAELGDAMTSGYINDESPPGRLQRINKGKFSFDATNSSRLEDCVSLINILESVRNILAKECVQKDSCKDYDELVYLSLAVPNSFSSNLINQAEKLVENFQRLNQDHKNSVIDGKWKLINIFSGVNDLCHNCTDNGTDNTEWAKIYVKNLMEAIDYIKSNLKNAIVNVVPAFNIGILRETYEVLPSCRNVYWNVCPCLERNDYRKNDFYDLITDAINQFRNLTSAHEYQDDDFAIIISDGLHINEFPKNNGTIDLSFLASDCFNFSKSAHKYIASMMWNNLVESDGQKSNILEYYSGRKISFKCPSEGKSSICKEYPFIRMSTNSKSCNESEEAVKPTFPYKMKSFFGNAVPNAAFRYAIVPDLRNLQASVQQRTTTSFLPNVLIGGVIFIFVICVVLRYRRAEEPSSEKIPLLANKDVEQIF